MSSISKISDKVAAVNTALMTSMNTKLGEGVQVASEAYADAKLAHETKDVAVNGAGGLVEVSLSDWDSAKAAKVAEMDAIISELNDDSANVDFDSLAELNTKVSNQNTTIGGFITGFIAAQDNACYINL